MHFEIERSLLAAAYFESQVDSDVRKAFDVGCRHLVGGQFGLVGVADPYVYSIALYGCIGSNVGQIDGFNHIAFGQTIEQIGGIERFEEQVLVVGCRCRGRQVADHDSRNQRLFGYVYRDGIGRSHRAVVVQQGIDLGFAYGMRSPRAFIALGVAQYHGFYFVAADGFVAVHQVDRVAVGCFTFGTQAGQVDGKLLRVVDHTLGCTREALDVDTMFLINHLRAIYHIEVSPLAGKCQVVVAFCKVIGHVDGHFLPVVPIRSVDGNRFQERPVLSVGRVEQFCAIARRACGFNRECDGVAGCQVEQRGHECIGFGARNGCTSLPFVGRAGALAPLTLFYIPQDGREYIAFERLEQSGCGQHGTRYGKFRVAYTVVLYGNAVGVVSRGCIEGDLNRIGAAAGNDDRQFGLYRECRVLRGREARDGEGAVVAAVLDDVVESHGFVGHAKDQFRQRG